LAHGREKRKLWPILQAKADDPRFAACVAFLRRVRDQADVLQPYEFYANVLGELGGWTKMLARLGFDAADPIDEFLNAALDFERANTPSLEAFLHSIETTQIEIKRDQDRGAGAVRVMTVHASKGLEAPVVILPDTCMTPRHGMLDKNLLDAEKTPLWKLEKKRDDPVRRAARDIGVDERMKEYRRLLYVALTRARDRLYICGHDGRNRRETDCWYNLVEKAMSEVDAVALGEGITRFGESVQGAAPVIAGGSEVRELPAWARTPAAREAVLEHVAPSIIQARQAVRLAAASPAAANSLERGRAIHRALERLANAPADRWSDVALEAAMSIVEDKDVAQSAANEALKVRRDLLLAHVFAAPSYGEVPLSGVVEWRGSKVDLAARLDRVVVGKDDVLIVEFKTDKVVPKADSTIPKSYVTQLALYRLAVARLFPGRTVNCGILWTAEAKLTILPSRLLHEAEGAA
jgi:ATP-dependent helicase/nuclease subunit A